MATTETIKFTPDDLAKNLKERVKQEFVNLIPEEHWDKFITDTTKDFMEKDLQSMIKEVLKEESKKKIIAYFNDNIGGWDYKKQRDVLDNRMKETIVALAPAMFAEMMEQMIVNMMQNIRNRGY